MTLMTGDEKHGPSATSTLDVLWVLYDQVLRVSPDRLDDPGRDRFLLSKGHGPAAYYAVLAAKGFIPESWLPGFGSAESRLGYHPDRNLVPGVEIASGSLGHGLPIAVGLAHGLIARGLAEPRVFVLVGDAELDEGSNNEAIVYAGAAGLANLVVVAVDNQSSTYGWGTGGIEAHFAVAGWSVTRVDGRDHAALAMAFGSPGSPGSPVLARGRGATARGRHGGREGVFVMSDMRTVFASAASSTLEEDPLAAVVLAEISADLFAKAAARYPERVLNVGIREQLMVSVAGGLALAGLRPIVHTYAPFLVERAYEQVKLDLAHQDARAVLVSIGASYDAAESGRTHQAPEDVALMDTVPGFAVQVPGHPDEVPALLRSALGALGSRSTYLRLSAERNRTTLPLRPGLQVVRPGRETVVVAVGPMLSPVLDAVGDLDVTVAYTTTVRPFDGEGLRALVASSGSSGSGAVVLVEPYLAGTSAHCVSEALAGRAFRLLSLGVGRDELRRYGTPADQAAWRGLDAGGIRRSLTEFLELA